MENSVLVKVPHNHKVETGDNLKKQMFVYVLTGRIQRDKTLNIRAIYEEIATKYYKYKCYFVATLIVVNLQNSRDAHFDAAEEHY